MSEIEIKLNEKYKMKSNKNKKRCADTDCRRKLTILDFMCECENRYCSYHRLPEEHNCITLNIKKEEAKSRLINKLMNEKLENDKLINKL